MKKILTGLLAIAMLAACSSAPSKKVVIMASGKLSANGDVVTYSPGTQHNEEKITLQGDKLTVKNGTESKDYPVPSAGTWLLNLQNDTLIGSYQLFAEAGSREGKISQEQMVERMDSLKQLMTGSNVTDLKKNHFLAPGDFRKVSSSPDAIVVGPFKGMPAKLEPDSKGNVPEVYKFITNKDARETLVRLEKLLKEQ
jgi:lipopolysaccharide export system protein LptA